MAIFFLFFFYIIKPAATGDPCLMDNIQCHLNSLRVHTGNNTNNYFTAQDGPPPH